MRKIIVSMNITLNGFMSGPGNALNWHLENWNNQIADCLTEQLSKADTILFGRITYTAMEHYWSAAIEEKNIARDDIAFATLLDTCKKIVFSKTLVTTNWCNTSIVKNNLDSEIKKLKNRRGKHIIVYGSGSLVESLLGLELVDEFSIWVHPVMIGEGKSFFDLLHKNYKLTLKYSRIFSSGVVLLYYQATKSNNNF